MCNICNFNGLGAPPGQAIRGSDSQLCPKPPPKPSKLPLARRPRSPCLQARVPISASSNIADSSCTSPSLAAPSLESACVETPDSSWSTAGNLLVSVSYLFIYFCYLIYNICSPYIQQCGLFVFKCTNIKRWMCLLFHSHCRPSCSSSEAPEVPPSAPPCRLSLLLQFCSFTC